MGRAQGPVIIICLVFLWLWSQTYLDSNPASGIYENTSRLRPLTHSPASRIDPRMERYHYPGTFTLQRLWRHCKNRNLEIPGACIKEGRAEYAEYQATETREPLAEKNSHQSCWPETLIVKRRVQWALGRRGKLPVCGSPHVSPSCVCMSLCNYL